MVDPNNPQASVAGNAVPGQAPVAPAITIQTASDGSVIVTEAAPVTPSGQQAPAAATKEARAELAGVPERFRFSKLAPEDQAAVARALQTGTSFKDAFAALYPAPAPAAAPVAVPAPLAKIESQLETVGAELAKAVADGDMTKVIELQSKVVELNGQKVREELREERETERQQQENATRQEAAYNASADKASAAFPALLNPDSEMSQRFREVWDERAAVGDTLLDAPDAPFAVAAMVAAEFANNPAALGQSPQASGKSSPFGGARPVTAVPGSGAGASRTLNEAEVLSLVSSGRLSLAEKGQLLRAMSRAGQ